MFERSVQAFLATVLMPLALLGLGFSRTWGASSGVLVAAGVLLSGVSFWARAGGRPSNRRKKLPRRLQPIGMTALLVSLAATAGVFIVSVSGSSGAAYGAEVIACVTVVFFANATISGLGMWWWRRQSSHRDNR